MPREKNEILIHQRRHLSIIAPKKRRKKWIRLRDAYQKRLFGAKFDCGLEPAQKSQIKASKVGCQPSKVPLSCHPTRETAVQRERERERERETESERAREQIIKNTEIT